LIYLKFGETLDVYLEIFDDFLKSELSEDFPDAEDNSPELIFGFYLSKLSFRS